VRTRRTLLMRQRPAGLVLHRHALAHQQRAHAAHDNAVLRQQRHRRATGVEVLQHGRGGLFRQALEVGGGRQAQIHTSDHGAVQVHVGLQAQRGHALVHQGLRKRIRAADLQHQPGTGALVKQGIGGGPAVVGRHPRHGHEPRRAFQVAGAAGLQLQPLARQLVERIARLQRPLRGTARQRMRRLNQSCARGHVGLLVVCT
jgi:hypothetical protein